MGKYYKCVTHHHPTPLHSLACVSTHLLPVLSTVHVDVLRGVPCLGHGLFAVTDGGRCRRKHLKGEHYSEQPNSS
jgi:ribulose-5-phosphate 4-epimerase/fuculose-1-phosphate aldolase